MFTLKHLKNAPTCFDIIQIIFRELICSLLKSLILKFVKNVKVNVVMWQHNIWCVYMTAVQHTSSHRTHVHTPNVMLPHHHIDFYIFNKF